MPTVLRFGSLRAVIYPNDHRPAHVHVIGNGCEAVYVLQCPNGPPVLRENFGFGLKDVNRIKVDLAANLVIACQEWERIHGQP